MLILISKVLLTSLVWVGIVVVEFFILNRIVNYMKDRGLRPWFEVNIEVNRFFLLILPAIISIYLIWFF